MESEKDYKNGLIYKMLASLCEKAGFKIVYETVPDDSIDGAILARADESGRMIMMPIDDPFDRDEQAAFTLGHEMAHLLIGLGSPDDFYERETNEAICNIVGAALASLAENIAGTEIEKAAFPNK